MDRNTPTRLQVQIFIAMLALGTLAHEISWMRMFVQDDGANLFDYLAPYQLLIPAPTIPAWLAGVDHLLLFTLCGLMLFHRKRLVFAVAMFPVIFSHLFVQGTKPANHLFMLQLVYASVFMYGIFEAVRARRYPDDEERRLQNGRFLRACLMVIVVGTYAVAANSKLNAGFFDMENTVARTFFWKTVSPLNYLIKATLGGQFPGLVDWLWDAYAVLGVASTIFFEFGIPIFLVIRRTRRLGIFLGALFHMMILYSSALDFSMVMLSCYVMLLTGDEVVDFLTNFWRRPTKFAVFGSFAVSAYLVFVVYGFQSLEFLFGTLMTPYRVIHLLAVAYLVFVLGRWVLDRRVERPVVLFDGQCVFCTTTVRWLRRLDWVGLAYEDFKVSPIPAARGIDQLAVRRELHLLRGEKVWTGFRAFREFAVTSGGPLVVISPLLFLPGMAWIGSRVYGAVARNRYAIMGKQCDGESCSIG